VTWREVKCSGKKVKKKYTTLPREGGSGNVSGGWRTQGGMWGDAKRDGCHEGDSLRFQWKRLPPVGEASR